MADPVKTTEIDVLTAVVDRLRDQISEFTDSTCFLTSQPLQSIPSNVRDNLFCTVSPMSSTFEQDVFDGAGANAICEDAGVYVVVYNAIRLDRVGADTSLLTHASRGLLKIKQDILAALAGHRLVDGSANELLIREMAPMSADAINSGQLEKRPEHVGDMGLVFNTPFEWSLS